ncbi:hypothetical protein [Streptomyces gobiensis]|uniref:hypothetical protein n=1 Tax=Streptomyces gobiensis TaxID=2875706 RepID=UPI001E413189|nr:hypothetical protein [Streptomyces gobiensis]UGY92760.1 hypothetical protein test1122_14235 [Streptomyces gobiensis]
MLMLTPTAIEAVRTMISTEGAPADAGLRISATDGSETLQLGVTAAPADGDEVMVVEGARLFLDEQAAAFLDDKILDTGLDADGQGALVLGQQHNS